MGVHADAVVHTAVIGACSKGGEWEAALDVYRKMDGPGAEPVAATFLAVLKACQQGGAAKVATEVRKPPPLTPIKCQYFSPTTDTVARGVGRRPRWSL